jgi:mono/diheme cytochrome c family protein
MTDKPKSLRRRRFFFSIPEQSEKSGKAMKTTMWVLLALFAGLVVATPRQQGPDSQKKPTRFEDYLPAGEGRNLILQGCVQCHELRNTVSQRKTAAGWRRTVNEMIWRGAPLSAEESETIIKYLALSFGSDKPLADAFKKKPEQKH